MTTTYHPPHVGPYDNHVLPSYPSTLAQVRCPMPSEAVRAAQYSRFPQLPFQPQLGAMPQTQPRDVVASTTLPPSAGSRHSTRTSTPNSETSVTGQLVTSASNRSTQTLVHHSLKVPSCINPKGGNLADFAAQITCLFWFESMDTLQAAEQIRSRPASATVPKLTKYAIPYPAFKKWAYSVLSTTQVTQSVILLALMFVYRLKKANPSVKGRSGSEYRLLTVALMLGNKFLDDNTYTNKTWAEVSGISVQEIHVMEVEFLSNMRYSLLATKEEWEAWLTKLASFSDYYERALTQPTSPIALSSPTNIMNSPLVSPTASGMPSLTPPAVHYFSPHSKSQPALQNQDWAPTSPLSAKSNLYRPTKKRALDEDVAEPPAKRQSVRPPQSMPQARPPVVGEQPIRLPVPNLSLNTNTSVGQAPYIAPVVYPSQTTQSNVSLPPLGSGMRAMATVYSANSIPTSATSHLPLPVTTAPAHSMPQATLTPTSGMPVHAALGFGTPSRRHSPGTLAAFSSPIPDMYHQQPSVVHTPLGQATMSHSPSVYLQQRPSPYKPIRHVNTLLYPPPSASLNEYHMSAAAPQMHYQPLGRRNDLRTGVVPEYMTLSYRAGQPMQLIPHAHPHAHHPN